jgi:hypothetical protein
MNARLETAINEMRGLGEADQARLGQVLTEMLAEVHSAGSFRAAMKDPTYRGHVESSVAAGQSDIDAGRTFSSDEILARSAARLKGLHG